MEDCPSRFPEIERNCTGRLRFKIRSQTTSLGGHQRSRLLRAEDPQEAVASVPQKYGRKGGSQSFQRDGICLQFANIALQCLLCLKLSWAHSGSSSNSLNRWSLCLCMFPGAFLKVSSLGNQRPQIEDPCTKVQTSNV